MLMIYNGNKKFLTDPRNKDRLHPENYTVLESESHEHEQIDGVGRKDLKRNEIDVKSCNWAEEGFCKEKMRSTVNYLSSKEVNDPIADAQARVYIDLSRLVVWVKNEKYYNLKFI